MSRRSRGFIFILAVAIVILAVVIDRGDLKSVRQRLVESKQRGPDGQKYHGKTFTVVNIVDGDTFDLDIPDGEHETTRIRPLGIDTPETKHPKYPEIYYGSEATAFTEKLVLIIKQIRLIRMPWVNVKISLFSWTIIKCFRICHNCLNV